MSSEKVTVDLTVNGEPHSVSVEPRELLSQTLRKRLGYTSLNIGCESTLCGACTVHTDGKAVKSCTRLTVQADGTEVRTAIPTRPARRYGPRPFRGTSVAVPVTRTLSTPSRSRRTHWRTDP